MANYLMRYKGIYRLKAYIDQNTNDFPRDTNGLIDCDDVYIKCDHGCQIYHYGRSILVAYIPSIGRGHNILKAIAHKLIYNTTKEDENYVDEFGYDWDKMYQALLKEGTIKEITENDQEIEFKFHSKNINLIAEYLHPKTSGASISPFSSRNLPKSSYSIPLEDLNVYKEITNNIPKEDILLISQITKRFISNILSKSTQYRSKNITAEMRKYMLKGKEFIHFSGAWEQYLKYLKKELNKIGDK